MGKQPESGVTSRRKVLWHAAAAAGLMALRPLRAIADLVMTPFQSTSVSDACTLLWGDLRPVISDQVQLNVPQFAEDGSVVPVQVSCTLDGVRSIAILTEKNPVSLSAHFLLSEKATPFVATQIKLSDSGKVLAIAETAEGLYMAEQKVQVSISGCG